MSEEGAEWAPCPSCQGKEATKVKFTWWGGLLGAKLGNVVKCNACSRSYNGKPGGDNKGLAATMMIIGGVIGLVIGFLIFAR